MDAATRQVLVTARAVLVTLYGEARDDITRRVIERSIDGLNSIIPAKEPTQ